MKTRSKPRCPHCGSFALTEAEESVLVALYTAPHWPTLAQLAHVVGCTKRTVRRAIASLPALIMSEASRRGGPTRYELTPEGRQTVETLVGNALASKAVVAAASKAVAA